MLIPYAAPAEPFHKETEIKKSIFIAHLVPVNSEEEAQRRWKASGSSTKMPPITATPGASVRKE